MRTTTTTRLHLPSLPRAWWQLSTPAAAAIVAFCLVAIAGLAGRIATTPAPIVVPTPSLLVPSQPVIVIQKEQQLVAAPDPQVRAELEQLRARISELEAQRVAPQVIVQPIVEQPAPAAPQAPAVEQPAYQTDNQPPEPPQQPVAPREVVPVAAPQVPPTAVPPIVQAAQPLGHDSEVEKNWAQVQWQSEHCIADKCYP